MSPPLEMRAVAKRYVAGLGGCVASVDVLRGVDLVLRAGDAVAVVGPPGSGKSTLLLAAAGLLVPDTGEILWLGDASRAAAMRHTMYHIAGTPHPSPRVTSASRVHLIDDPDTLGGVDAARLAAWIARRCLADSSVLLATRSRATAHALAPRVLALAGGRLHPDIAVATTRVAEPPRSLALTGD